MNDAQDNDTFPDEEPPTLVSDEAIERSRRSVQRSIDRIFEKLGIERESQHA